MPKNEKLLAVLAAITICGTGLFLGLAGLEQWSTIAMLSITLGAVLFFINRWKNDSLPQCALNRINNWRH